MWDAFGPGRLYEPKDIVVGVSPLHGRGVFAVRVFEPGDNIETAPLILLPSAERAALRETILFDYYFLVDRCVTGVAIGLGYSSFYNHSYTANAVYDIAEAKAMIIVKAHRSILPGEEILLNYNGEPNDMTPVYFALGANA